MSVFLLGFAAGLLAAKAYAVTVRAIDNWLDIREAREAMQQAIDRGEV